MPAAPEKPGFASFRTRLLLAMMLVVSAVTGLALFFAQRNLAASVRRDLEREFQSQLAALHTLQEMRHAALAERCRALARKPRIHAALEDGALDLLYPSARDELLDVMEVEDPHARETAPYAIHAKFYRFLDHRGAVLSPPDARDVGQLSREAESRLALPAVPDKPQFGYLVRSAAAGAGKTVDEIMAMPIVSTESGEAIAALVLGFKPVDLERPRVDGEFRSGIWLDGGLHLPSLSPTVREKIGARLGRDLAGSRQPENSFALEVEGTPRLVFYKLLNPGSPYPPAYEVCMYELTAALGREENLIWQFVGVGVLLLAGAFVTSRFLAVLLSGPVEKLAEDSEVNRTGRARAEAALEVSHEELQRSARFSSDASHQLKTPVTVLRAGLEEVLADDRLPPDIREEISGLVHQTFRLASVIDDLLLLSRMDAGRLVLDVSAVNLTQLIEGWVDDLGTLPDAAELEVETDYPPGLYIEGEKRYTTLILQNLMENARKYNRPGGRIRVAARGEGDWGILTIGNTGAPIPPRAQGHIFERFHRGTIGENVPGHGLGLNLARELARLHRGDLRLLRSDHEWTEFEVRFRLTRPVPVAG